jgi:hypothetical protein
MLTVPKMQLPRCFFNNVRPRKKFNQIAERGPKTPPRFGDCMGPSSILSRRGRYHLRQQRLALGLGAVALHRRGKTLEDAVFERSDDGVVDIALAADRGRVRQFVGGGAHRIQYLLLAATLACRGRDPRQRFQHHG